MDKNSIIELTKKLYKITLLFPKKEPLRYKTREAADEIMEEAIGFLAMQEKGIEKYSINSIFKEKDAIFSLEKNLEVINSFFEIAKWQRWVDYFDILEIQEGYARIRENLLLLKERKEFSQNLELNLNSKPELPIQEEKKAEAQPAKKEEKLDGRKEKILKLLEKTERLQVGEANKFFPDVSKRTLRRDFQKLTSQGIIQKIGQKNNTFYKITR